MRFETLAIHSGREPDPATGALATRIYQTSTFVFENAGKTRGYDYSRTANPTRKVLEDTIARLEGGKAGFACATGMAAEATIMHLLHPGDHVISGDDVYGGTYRLFRVEGKEEDIDQGLARVTAKEVRVDPVTGNMVEG